MKRAMTIAVAAVLGLAWYVPHTKREAVNACRFEVSKKWNDVLDNACIQTWSPFYNKDGKNVFPTCDETASAKKFMIACMAASGFSSADDCTDESDQFHGRCYERSMPLQMFDSIAESDLISDSSLNPWMGYIWNSRAERYEWRLAQFKTLNECQLSLEHSIGTFDHSRPVGCTYSGNNLLRVRIMNALYGGANYTCIAETATPAEAEKKGMRYGPAIGPVPTDPGSWHCVDTPRNLEAIKGPAYIPPPPEPTIPVDKIHVSNLRIERERYGAEISDTDWKVSATVANNSDKPVDWLELRVDIQDCSADYQNCQTVGEKDVELEIPGATSCLSDQPTPPGQTRQLASCAINFEGLPQLKGQKRRITWSILRARCPRRQLRRAVSDRVSDAASSFTASSLGFVPEIRWRGRRSVRSSRGLPADAHAVGLTQTCCSHWRLKLQKWVNDAE
jgi:hypothetical protein